MIADVLIYGSRILRQHSEEVVNNNKLEEFINTLFETLEKKGGIGLAAPQIGELKRTFVMDTFPLDDEQVEKFKRVVINPLILATSNETVRYSEGCLSIPDIWEEVERPKEIEVRYLDETFEPVERKLNGTEARIFQHEYDHLEGILFIDKIHPMRKVMISGKLKSLVQKTKKYHRR
ncbi:MAG: peptide deformylase [Bacteroidales bacterium]|nr:peptide deformylase [Bacteroidales bacterium]